MVGTRSDGQAVRGKQDTERERTKIRPKRAKHLTCLTFRLLRSFLPKNEEMLNMLKVLNVWDQISPKRAKKLTYLAFPQF